MTTARTTEAVEPAWAAANMPSPARTTIIETSTDAVTRACAMVGAVSDLTMCSMGFSLSVRSN